MESVGALIELQFCIPVQQRNRLHASTAGHEREEFAKLERLNPDSSAVHGLVAEALDGEGKTLEAIEEVKTALRLTPKEPNLNFVLGHLYWEAEKWDEAVAAFQAELVIQPNDAVAIAYLGDSALKRGDNQRCTAQSRCRLGPP